MPFPRLVEAAWHGLGLHSRVGRALLKRSLLIGLAAAALVSPYQAYTEFREQQTRLQQHFQTLAAAAAPALISSLWSFDTQHTHILLEGLTRGADVSAVRLALDSGDVQHLGQAELSAHTYVLSVPLQHVEDGQAHRLGTLLLIRDLQTDHQRLATEILASATGNTVVILLVMLMVLWSHHHIVQRRLMRIASRLVRTSPEDLRQWPPPVPEAAPSRSGDEIDDLAQAIGQLKTVAGGALAALDQQNQHLAQALEELTQAKGLLLAVIDTAPVRIFWKDTQSRYLGANRLFAGDAGVDSPQALIGRSDDELTWQAQAASYQADDAAVMRAGTPKLNYLEEQSHGDGTTLWLRTSKVPMVNQAGQVTGVLGIYDDITRQKLADQRLAEQLDELRRWQSVMLDREDRILALKAEVNELLQRAGLPLRYEHATPASEPTLP